MTVEREGRNMTVYAIAQLKFTERAAYDRYQAQFMGVFSQFEGALLAADEAPVLVEGSSDVEKVVLMSFPHEPAFKRWAQSADYRRISQDRLAWRRYCRATRQRL